MTTRLILKRGALPKWAPRGIMSKAESWILEESEVDPVQGTVRCTTKNLDHVKVMRVEEHVTFQRTDNKCVRFTIIIATKAHPSAAKPCSAPKHGSSPILGGA